MPSTGPAAPPPAVPEPDESRSLLVGPAADGFAAGLARWAADARTAEAGAARSRERWLRRQAEEEATLAGVLCDLAERGASAMVETSTGRHRSQVLAVAHDFVVLRSADGRQLLLALDAITTVRPDTDSTVPVGDRRIEPHLRLIDALAYLVGDRPRVLAVTRSGERVAGSLRSVGLDVVSIALDGNARPVVFIPVAALTEIGLV